MKATSDFVSPFINASRGIWAMTLQLADENKPRWIDDIQAIDDAWNISTVELLGWQCFSDRWVEGNLHPQFFGQRIVEVTVSGLLVMTQYWILHQLQHSLLYLHLADIPETLKEVKTSGAYPLNRIQRRSGGIVAFYMHFTSFIEWNWRSPVRTYISSLYFCTYTMTSVGYGDIGPKNLGDFQKVWRCSGAMTAQKAAVENRSTRYSSLYICR